MDFVEYSTVFLWVKHVHPSHRPLKSPLSAALHPLRSMKWLTPKNTPNPTSTPTSIANTPFGPIRRNWKTLPLSNWRSAEPTLPMWPFAKRQPTATGKKCSRAASQIDYTHRARTSVCFVPPSSTEPQSGIYTSSGERKKTEWSKWGYSPHQYTAAAIPIAKKLADRTLFSREVCEPKVPLVETGE